MKRLPEGQVAEVETHLLVCEPCQQTLADLDAFIGAIRTVSPVTSRGLAPRRPRPGWQWGLAAAAAVVLAGLLYFGNAGTTAIPATIVLSSLRGGEGAPTSAPANTPLDLKISSTQLAGRDGLRIEIVTESGRRQWTGPVTRSAEGTPLVRLSQRLSSGLYWVRLYSPENQLLQEYGLQVN